MDNNDNGRVWAIFQVLLCNTFSRQQWATSPGATCTDGTLKVFPGERECNHAAAGKFSRGDGSYRSPTMAIASALKENAARCA